MTFLPNFRETALDLLFPMQCIKCRSEGSLLCVPCAEELMMVPPSCIVCKRWKPAAGRVMPGRTCRPCRKKSDIFAFFSPYLYQNQTIRGLIHQLKYLRVREIHTVLADLVIRSLLHFSIQIPKKAIVIPIPLYPSRERVRGFNQSRLITESICPTLGVGHRLDILLKTKKTIPQMELSAEKRRTNVVGTFTVANPAAVKDKIIILLDDIKTTGATLQEATRVLKDAGAKRVWAITVAH